MTQGNHQSEMPGTGPQADWEALARHVTGESSPEESERIDAWLAAYPEQKEILATLDTAMSRLAEDVPSDLDIDGALERLRSKRDALDRPSLEISSEAPRSRPVPVRARWRVPFPAIAASGLLAIGALSWAALRGGPPAEPSIGEARMLATGVGVRDSLTLPDGTRIILGPLSSVTIAEGYGESGRQVEIKGDAWFDVVHDDSRPFTVVAGDATIVDIGTKFMVRSDAGEGHNVVSVSVTEGSVSMRPANDPEVEGVILEAGDNAILRTDGMVVTRPGTVDDDDLAWMAGRLVFRETPLSEVVSSLHRWYGIELRVGDKSLASRPITATFENETPERVLDVLRLVLGADIQRRGDTAVVLPRAGGMRSR